MTFYYCLNACYLKLGSNLSKRIIYLELIILIIVDQKLYLYSFKKKYRFSLELNKNSKMPDLSCGSKTIKYILLFINLIFFVSKKN